MIPERPDADSIYFLMFNGVGADEIAGLRSEGVV
jgi:hypothetical protein